MRCLAALALVGCASSATWTGGEVVLAIELDGDGVVPVYVDGEHNQDIVCTPPRRVFRVLTGPLSDGPHEVRVAGAVTIEPVEPHMLGAPSIVARPGASDVPLLMFAERRGDGWQYSVIFSNEDGGTGLWPALLLGRYGRTTDIEWVWRTSGEYQGDGHRAVSLDASRPELQVATLHNTMRPAFAPGPRMRPAPVLWEGDGPRERVMDAHPWTWAVSAREALRESGLDLREFVFGDADEPARLEVRVGELWARSEPSRRPVVRVAGPPDEVRGVSRAFRLDESFSVVELKVDR